MHSDVMSGERVLTYFMYAFINFMQRKEMQLTHIGMRLFIAYLFYYLLTLWPMEKLLNK